MTKHVFKLYGHGGKSAMLTTVGIFFFRAVTYLIDLELCKYLQTPLKNI